LLHTSQFSLAIPSSVGAISTATSAIANHPVTVAVHQAVMEPYCTDLSIIIIIVIIIITKLS